MIVGKPYLDCVALGRLGVEDVPLVGDVVVTLVLAGEAWVLLLPRSASSASVMLDLELLALD